MTHIGESRVMVMGLENSLELMQRVTELLAKLTLHLNVLTSNQNGI